MTLNTPTQEANSSLVLWDGSLPNARGVIATHYQTQVPINTQIAQATVLLNLITTQDTNAFNDMHGISSPAPMLVQVPGTSSVRFVACLAKYLTNPLQHPTGHKLHGWFLAISEDLRKSSDTPRRTVLLPDDVLKTNMVLTPTEQAFKAKLKQKHTEDDTNAADDSTQWFKHDDVGNNRSSQAKVCPLPHFLAYDAFAEDVTAQVLWERVCEHEDIHEGNGVLFTSIKEFFQAVHTKHRANQESTAPPPLRLFNLCPHEDSIPWAEGRLTLGGSTLVTSVKL